MAHPLPSPSQSLSLALWLDPLALPDASASPHASLYDALALPIASSNWKSRFNNLSSPPSDDHLALRQAELWRAAPSFSLDELFLPLPHPAFLAASDWLLLDSPFERQRFDSQIALKQELSYATYLGVSHLIIPPFIHPHLISDYARSVYSVLISVPSSVILSVLIPISSSSDIDSCLRVWEDWHAVRKLCGYHSRLNIAIKLSNFSNLGQVNGTLNLTDVLIQKWSCEPIGFIWIPASTFISNIKQYPVLSKSCQTFLQTMFKFKPTIILSETTQAKHQSGGHMAYAQYIRFLENKFSGVPVDPIECFANDYLDYLQAPLQPLADNLDSQVYEGFEKDPVKYSKYEEAIYQALCDRPSNITQEIAICGAGRGPLVAACIRAASRSGRAISVVAIEKNPNSHITLQQRLKYEWDPKMVQVWFGDMRDYQPTEPIDIVVSELLGSFGDNELSPECLDGVTRWLAADGISIPSSYCSFIAPLSSSKIHSKVMKLGKFQTPYVVMIHAGKVISGSANSANGREPVQQVWSFEHPRTDLVFSQDTGVPITNFHNSRSSHLTFSIPHQSICHGLAGYFRATLYGSVLIETHPESEMSREMLSWFPIFFPLQEPVYCPKDSELDVHIWRLTDQASKRVWYEWAVEAFQVEPGTRRLEPKRTSGQVSIDPDRTTTFLSKAVVMKVNNNVPDNTDPALLGCGGRRNEEEQTKDVIRESTTHHDHDGDVDIEERGDEDVVVGEDEDVIDDGKVIYDHHERLRVRLGISSLHNIMGQESFVKW